MKVLEPGQGLAGPRRGMDLVGGLGTVRLQTPASRAECSDGDRGRSAATGKQGSPLELCSVDPVRGGLSQGTSQLWEEGCLVLHRCQGAEEAGSKVLSGAALLLWAFGLCCILSLTLIYGSGSGF